MHDEKTIISSINLKQTIFFTNLNLLKLIDIQVFECEGVRKRRLIFSCVLIGC